LVGLPGNSSYHASGSLRGEWRFERDGGIQILVDKGFQLDIIDKVDDPAHGGLMPKSWLAHKK
jgi:hypothetical protein